MSRLTGNEVYDLMEAYNSVYTPQELTEDQIWDEVEYMVNLLMDEGYDLSDYTWEEIYEEYLNEMGQPGQRTTGQNSNVWRPAPTRPPQVAGGGMGGMRGSGRDRNASQTSSSPGALRTQPSYQSPFAGARDAAFARAKNIQGSPVLGPRIVGPGGGTPPRPSGGGGSRPSGGGGGSRPSGGGGTPPRPSGTAPTAAPKPTPTGSPMDQWRAANTSLATAADEKARIRGTQQTDNPLMRSMRSRLPMNSPSIQSPAVAKLGPGNQSLVNNPNAFKGASK